MDRISKQFQLVARLLHIYNSETIKKRNYIDDGNPSESRTYNASRASLLRRTEAVTGVGRGKRVGMEMEVENRYITIKNYIDDGSRRNRVRLERQEHPTDIKRRRRRSEDIVVKNLYVYVDPYQINRMKKYSSSHEAINLAAQLAPGKEIIAFGVGRVVASSNPGFKKDDLVAGVLGWEEYTVVAILKEKLGFDDAFNYKEEPDLKSALKRYFPEGIDIYFDNVGGEMLEAAVANMNTFGRVAACGAIAEYTDKEKKAVLDVVDVIYKRITIRGFLASDYFNVYGDCIASISGHLQKGRIHVLEDISHGLETAPSAFAGLFRGDNVGKKIIKVADACLRECFT
ncbi:uncharacterized protein A4U43_C01F24540 [Asparagus officinalis]|uniref:Alcohol dehydrogenase-like C-terminal domain-containing protein n=1 Tax=Asparagus officinalis TaxID=4686 RepID=A0A5P1FRT6_ASPOF|nr:uncharacterized protein A4U43_C01F24540 [Asparagus officinalis]